jgi:hypothetical protein
VKAKTAAARSHAYGTSADSWPHFHRFTGKSAPINRKALQDRAHRHPGAISAARHSAMNFKKISTLFSVVLGNPATQTFENRTFNAVMIFIGTAGAILLSYDFFLGNTVSQCIDLSCIIYSSSCYAYSRRRQDHGKLDTISFIFLYIATSTGWFFNNGMHGSIPYFFFILSCYAGVFFKKPLRNAIPLLIATVLAFISLEFFNPEFVTSYTSKLYNFIDVGVSIIICLIINGVSIHIIFKKYDVERTLNKKMLNQVIADKELIEKSMTKQPPT